MALKLDGEFVRINDIPKKYLENQVVNEKGGATAPP
jgi:hypothetical protein